MRFHLGSRRTPAGFGVAAALGLALMGLPGDRAGDARAAVPAGARADDARVEWGIVVHGGAGTIRREDMTPEQDAAYRAKLTEAIRAGHAILADGGAALDAVEATLNILENSPLFNSGKGAVFTNSGANELDASIMDGSTLNAGAVAGVKHVKNPISLARMVMERSRHVMLAREGAEEFALEQGVELVPTEYFFTEWRWESLQRAIRAEQAMRTSQADGPDLDDSPDYAMLPPAWTSGTVGAAALDQHGNLAAGTSTGGMTNKRWGRIGDSPIIGAGTYADNRSCAVSATGHGEYFIRNVVAHDICARMLYQGVSLEEAADAVIHGVLVEQGATGGVIAIDRDGNIAMPFNTEGMYRGWVGPDGRVTVKIYKDE